jgi:xylulokinase
MRPRMTASRSDEVFVGLDLGTSGLKAVALDSQAGVLARAQRRYDTQRPERGAAEQGPSQWIDAVTACVHELCEVVGTRRITAIGLSGMLPTLVTVDSAGEVIGSAITWQDDRAELYGQRLREAVGANRLYQRSGQWLDGRYLLPMYLRVADRDPSRAADTHMLLGAKDWLFSWLTGAALTDPSTATGVGAYQLEPGTWMDDVLDAAAEIARGPIPGLPEIVPSETVLPLNQRAAIALGLVPGLAVCVGGADSVLGALGLGATKPGSISYIAGTSTVILGTTTTLRPDPAHRYLITPLAGAAGWAHEMDLLATGSAIKWLAELLGLGHESAVLELAAGADLDAAPIVLPYFAPGEQGALWNPQLSGAILGLHVGTDRASLARGLVSGIVLESARCVAVLAEQDITGPLLVAGGSAIDPSFRADLADATGREVVIGDDAELDYSAHGAARLAATAVGVSAHALAPPATTAQHARADRAHIWRRLGQLADRHRSLLFPDTPNLPDTTNVPDSTNVPDTTNGTS